MIGPTVLTLALAAILAFDPPQTPPRPKPVPSAPDPAPRRAPAPASSAVLLITADEACTIFVDGEKIADLRTDEVRRIPVSLGQHLVRAAGASREWRQIVDVTAARQYVLVTELKTSPAPAAKEAPAPPPPSASPPAPPPAPKTAPPASASAAPEPAGDPILAAGARVLAAAIEAIQREYVEPPAEAALVAAASRGTIDAVDPPSQFFTPEEYARLR